jgi:hypothetical protein
MTKAILLLLLLFAIIIIIIIIIICYLTFSYDGGKIYWYDTFFPPCYYDYNRCKFLNLQVTHSDAPYEILLHWAKRTEEFNKRRKFASD